MDHRPACQALSLLAALALVAALASCSGSPEADAKWYLNDKPADMRVPVSGQTDPGDSLPPTSE
jgi:hypothetical protein